MKEGGGGRRGGGEVFFCVCDEKGCKKRQEMDRALSQVETLVRLQDERAEAGGVDEDVGPLRVWGRSLGAGGGGRGARGGGRGAGGGRGGGRVRRHRFVERDTMLYRNAEDGDASDGDAEEARLQKMLEGCSEYQPALVTEYQSHVDAMKRVSEYTSTATNLRLKLVEQALEDYSKFKEHYNKSDSKCSTRYRGFEGQQQFHIALIAGQGNNNFAEPAREYLKSMHPTSFQSREDFEEQIQAEIESAGTCFQEFKENQVKIQEKVLYAGKQYESIAQRSFYGDSPLISTSTSLPVVFDTYRGLRKHLFVIFVSEGSKAMPIDLNLDNPDTKGTGGNNEDCELLLVCDERKPMTISSASREKNYDTGEVRYIGQELALRVMHRLSEGPWQKFVHNHVHVCTF